MEPEIESTEALSAETVENAPSNVSTVTEVSAPATLSAKTFDWTFLKSTRFYAIVMGAASFVLLDPSTQTTPWYVSLGKFLSILSTGFWGTKTIDRTVDKLSAE